MCREARLKPCNIDTILRSPPLKKDHKNLEKLMSLRKKEKGHRLCMDFRYLDQPSLKNKYLFPKIDHTLQRVGVYNRMSLHDSFSGYHQMIPLQINQLKEFFMFPWSKYMFNQKLPGLKSAGDTFRRTMAHVCNFFTMVYLDDIIICFKHDKEYFFYLRKIFYKNKFGEQESKKKHQGEHGLFENSWKSPYNIFSNRGNYIFCLQELNRQRMLGDPFEDRMLEHHYCKNPQL